MKVYCLFDCSDYYCDVLKGIFDSEEKAQEYIKNYQGLCDWEIRVVEVQ